MATASRTELAALEGCRITGEATLTHQKRRLNDGTVLSLVVCVYIFPHVTEGHLWVMLPARVRKYVRPGDRFTFRAQVQSYTRSNGTQDLGLGEVTVTGKQ